MRTSTTVKPVIVTAADAKYFVPLQYLVNSVRCNYPNRRVICVDLGLTNKQRIWLKRKDIRVRSIPKLIIDSHIPDWQKWNKPQYIKAVNERKLIWIDSDCILLDKIDWLDRHTVHNGLITFADTAALDSYGKVKGNECLRNKNSLGVFKDNEYPNNGVIGLNLTKSADKKFLLDWINNTKKPINRNSAACYDQGIFQLTLEEQNKTDCVLKDSRYNYPIVNTEDIQNVYDFQRTLFTLKKDGVKIVHFINKHIFDHIKFDPKIMNSLKRRFIDEEGNVLSESIRRDIFIPS